MSRLSGRTEVQLRAATYQELKSTLALIEAKVFRCLKKGERPTTTPLYCTEKSHSFRLDYVDGSSLFLKKFLSKSAYFRELFALELLKEAASIPRLVASFDETQVLLTEWIPHRQNQDFIKIAPSAARALGELHSSPRVRAAVRLIGSKLEASNCVGDFIVGDLKAEHILSSDDNVVRFCDLETFSIGHPPLLDLQQLIGLVTEWCPSKSSDVVNTVISAYASGCRVAGVVRSPKEIQDGLARLIQPHLTSRPEAASSDWKRQ